MPRVDGTRLNDEIKRNNVCVPSNDSILSATIAGNAADSEIDPLVEILKHAFVLKLSLRRMSEARELESLINKLYIQEDNTDAVISTLKLLIGLKNFQTDTETALVFAFNNLIAQSVF